MLSYWILVQQATAVITAPGAATGSVLILGTIAGGGIGAYKGYQADKRAPDEKTPEPVHEEKSKSDQ